MPTDNRKNIRQELKRQFGIDARKVSPFASGVMNDNFLVDSTHGKFVLRLYRKLKEPQTRFERYMLKTLAASSFPCPHPILTPQGKDVASIGGRPAILYPLIEGTQLKTATPAIMRQLGEMQAAIHTAFGKQRPPSDKPGWDPDDVRELMKKWKKTFLKSGFPSVEEYWRFLETELASCVFPAKLPRGFTHQDIKPENVIFNGKKVAGIIDFDNSYYGALLHDLTTTIIWWCFTDKKLDRKLTDAFIKGYETKRKLTKKEKDLLLGDGLRFRLLREMFIGPMTTLNNIPLAAKRADYFKKLYVNAFGK